MQQQNTLRNLSLKSINPFHLKQGQIKYYKQTSLSETSWATCAICHLINLMAFPMLTDNGRQMSKNLHKYINTNIKHQDMKHACSFKFTEPHKYYRKYFQRNFGQNVFYLVIVRRTRNQSFLTVKDFICFLQVLALW